jgi:hypothetical protein
MRGSYSPYLAKDPTAAERVEIAGRVYRGILDDWVRRAGAPPRLERGAAVAESRSLLELVERLGPWSLRWQEAQDNVAKSRATRYQSLSDHLVRMSDLEHGRFPNENDRARAAGAPVDARADDIPAKAARFFRPIDGWNREQDISARLQTGRPLNPAGIGVTSAEQAEIASRVYRAVLNEAVGRYRASPREDEARRQLEAIFDAAIAERLGFWSDLWSKAQDAADQERSLRSIAARASLGGVRSMGTGGRLAAIRAHIERMNDLEKGRFGDNARERAGRSAVAAVDVTRLSEFTEVARFFRIEAEDRLADGSAARDVDATDSGQAETASRIYRAILDGAARRYREAPGAGGVPADVALVFNSRLAERLAAWSARWARAQIHSDSRRASRFSAVRSHVERMAALEDGRSLREVLQRPVLTAGGIAAPAPPREFADVARFFRLRAVWELEEIKAR